MNIEQGNFYKDIYLYKINRCNNAPLSLDPGYPRLAGQQVTHQLTERCPAHCSALTSIVTSIVTSLISPHQAAEGGRRAGYWYRWRSRDWGQPSTGVGAGTVVASIALLNMSKPS